jgi:hypothetical protein
MDEIIIIQNPKPIYEHIGSDFRGIWLYPRKRRSLNSQVQEARSEFS